MGRSSAVSSASSTRDDIPSDTSVALSALWEALEEKHLPKGSVVNKSLQCYPNMCAGNISQEAKDRLLHAEEGLPEVEQQHYRPNTLLREIIMDSGCTSHMIPWRVLFWDFDFNYSMRETGNMWKLEMAIEYRSKAMDSRV
jgi:hypothetical protein